MKNCFNNSLIFHPQRFVFAISAVFIAILSVEPSNVIITNPGSRQIAMGEIGVSLADDENAQFWNPAGLGISNPRWNYGAASCLIEPLLPSFSLDMVHSAYTLCYQPLNPIGGFSLACNLVDLGESTWTDELGRELGTARSYDYVLGLSYGRNLKGLTKFDHSLGISIKYLRSALVPSFVDSGRETEQAVIGDLGYLFSSPIGIRFGANVCNLSAKLFSASGYQSNETPFCARTAIGYKNEWQLPSRRIIEVAAEYLLTLEIVNQEDDDFAAVLDSTAASHKRLGEFLHNLGGELSLFNTVSWRQGVSVDARNNVCALHWGLGISILNHLQFDYHRIRQLANYPIQYREYGFSLSFINIAKWSRRDFTWYVASAGQ